MNPCDYCKQVLLVMLSRDEMIIISRLDHVT